MENPPKISEQKKTEPAKARKQQPLLRKTKLPKKLLLFDLDLLLFIKSGNNTQDKLLLLTGVDPMQFAERMDFLSTKGLVCRDASNPSVFRLGIAGYDELAKKAVAEEKKAKKASAATTTSAISAFAKANVADCTQAESQTVSVPKLTSKDSSLVYEPGPESKPVKQADIDLFEMLRRGSPKNGNGNNMAVKIQTAMATARAGESLPFDQQVETLGGRDAVKEMIEKTTQSGECELCHAPFHLSVNSQENNPKYGYCFCGASYHKDCYEHLVNSQNSCIRCGKKLQIRMDKASEDAVKAIKKMFD